MGKIRKSRIIRFPAIMLLLFCVIGFHGMPAFAESAIFIESEYEVDGSGEYFTLDFENGVQVTEVTSSNPNVVSVDEIYSDFVYLYSKGVGSAIITAKGPNGSTDTCKVTVKPEPFVLDINQIELENYDGEDEIRVYSESNLIKSVTSSDKGIVRVVQDEKYSFEVIPVAAGTATITAEDVYQQKQTVTVRITQKYLDEMKYLDELEDAYDGVRYDDSEIYFFTSLSNVSVQVKINDITYTGVKDSQGLYTVKIPIFPVGTKVTYSLQKGEAVYSGEDTVVPGDLSDDAMLDLGKYDDTPFIFTGKKCEPKVEVDHFPLGKEDYRILKKDIDYTVTYINNLDVGKATVKVTGIGNYAGTTSETFNIIPKGTSISKLTGKKRSITVKWKKQSAPMSKTRITGYQIRYSTKSSLSGGKKVNVKGYSKIKKTIRGLKSKKKYYVQVRTYKVVNGKTYYSKWSKKKSVRVK